MQINLEWIDKTISFPLQSRIFFLFLLNFFGFVWNFIWDFESNNDWVDIDISFCWCSSCSSLINLTEVFRSQIEFIIDTQSNSWVKSLIDSLKLNISLILFSKYLNFHLNLNNQHKSHMKSWSLNSKYAQFLKYFWTRKLPSIFAWFGIFYISMIDTQIIWGINFNARFLLFF